MKDKLKVRFQAKDEFEILNRDESSDAFASRKKWSKVKALSFK